MKELKSSQPKFLLKKHSRPFSWSGECPYSKLLKWDLVYLLNTFGNSSLRIFAARKASLVTYSLKHTSKAFRIKSPSYLRRETRKGKKTRMACNSDIHIISSIGLGEKSSKVYWSIEFLKYWIFALAAFWKLYIEIQFSCSESLNRFSMSLSFVCKYLREKAWLNMIISISNTQPILICSKSTMEMPEKCAKTVRG